MAARCFPLLLLSFLLAGFVTASPTPRQLARQEASGTTSAASPEQTICGDIINDVNQGVIFFYASDAFACLTSVPFNDAVALRFINYYNTTMQFQSTLAYLKDPPEGYQQPAVDIIDGLEKIKNNVTAGVYTNQYLFEADLYKLVYSVHDDHVNLLAGIMSTFSFASQFELVTASLDGVAAPQIYIADDVAARQQNGGGDISPIVQINGVAATEYLTRFAALNSVGTVDPHADWNQLMYSPIQTAMGGFSRFAGGATFYEGDWLNFTFANGTTNPTEWVAIYTNTDFTGPLTTGGDYYNYFVLGQNPDSISDVPLPPAFNFSVAQESTIAALNFTKGWNNVTKGEYPPADVMQDSLEAAGVVTGYYLDDISTAVLSIPSFDEAGLAVSDFSVAVDAALSGAQSRNLNKLIVDLQGNPGGLPLLAFTTFRSIFPGIEPFAGSRRRSHDLANVLGRTTTNYWNSLLNSVDDPDDLRELFAADEWVITDRLNAATGANFSSWEEYFGPRIEKGDMFSLVERYDLANTYFDGSAFEGYFSTEYIPGSEPQGPGPWKPEDVVILTDGQCSSTCALFVEMMTHQAGARTVVVGGQPQTGPMQAASGTRGARAYDAYSLDLDFDSAIAYDPSTQSQLPSRDDTGMYVGQAGFNLRDQVRTAGNPAGPPLQFVYLAADCRIFWTLDSVLNMTALWHDAAAAMFDDPSRCVANSIGYTVSTANGTATTPKPPPQSTAVSPDLPAVVLGDSDPVSSSSPDTLGDKRSGPRAPVVLCTPADPKQCVPNVSQCHAISVNCDNGRMGVPVDACVRGCIVGQDGCPSDAPFCLPLFVANSAKVNSGVRTVSQTRAHQKGVCVPTVGNAKLGCPA
ncbi:peptidase S41 family protein [Xylariales sp. AK1849]|nr:peptidase S41 family protein [Xylariales sp. AK1849]